MVGGKCGLADTGNIRRGIGTECTSYGERFGVRVESNFGEEEKRGAARVYMIHTTMISHNRSNLAISIMYQFWTFKLVSIPQDAPDEVSIIRTQRWDSSKDERYVKCFKYVVQMMIISFPARSSRYARHMKADSHRCRTIQVNAWFSSTQCHTYPSLDSPDHEWKATTTPSAY